MKGLIYALGGGWGHLIRAVALSRAAMPHFQFTLLTNSPYAAWLTPYEPDLHFHCLAPGLSQAETCAQVRQFLQQASWDSLIVDTFPRGLGGELADLLPHLPRPRILIHRDLNPTYVQKKDLLAFVATHYDLILVPETGSHLPLANLPQVKQTAPWLCRNAMELPELAVARDRLGVGAAPLVLVLACGQPQELSTYGDLAIRIGVTFPQLVVRCLGATCPATCPPELWQFYYPAIDLLPAATVVVGAGGYNTVAECQALGRPLIAIPQNRLYDRQQTRLAHHRSNCTWVQNADGAIVALRSLLEIAHPPVPPPPYPNGAVDAVNILQTL